MMAHVEVLERKRARPARPGQEPGPARTARPAVAPGPASRHEDGESRGVRVKAVIVVHANARCALYADGHRGDWPSLEAAQEAAARTGPRLRWRESTPGVWVAERDDA